jgi:hypothetical protein
VCLGTDSHTTMVNGLGVLASGSSMSVSATRNAVRERLSGTRSCGRRGPASDGTTVDRSSSTCSVYRRGRSGSCHRPCSLAYASTSATNSALRPVKRRYRGVSSSMGK